MRGDIVEIAIVGGCGHVGLPLAIAFAQSGIQCIAFDIDERVVAKVNNFEMPFREEGADQELRNAVESGNLVATFNPKEISRAEILIMVIGTPVDDHMNPDPNAVVNALSECLPYMLSTQLVILRSTVFPGVTRRVENMLRESGHSAEVAFCPERIVEGQALKELRSLPQIVGARTDHAASAAASLFENLGVTTFRSTPEEAELAKLFTNAWRYIKFAAANQFWLMANEAGLDFSQIREAITFEYPRAADLPSAGFAAGPCLFKDTAQLAAFTNNNFGLGHSAMMVNEGLPLYVVDRIAREYPLEGLRVGILGMSFKADSDDIRSSLSYKLKRILRFKALEVLTTDPYVTIDPELLDLQEVLTRSDILIIGAPHDQYATVEATAPIFDIWNLRGNGSRI